MTVLPEESRWRHPTRQSGLDPALIDNARDQLGLPSGTPVSRVVRAALERLTGNSGSAGIVKVGRPPKTKART